MDVKMVEKQETKTETFNLTKLTLDNAVRNIFEFDSEILVISQQKLIERFGGGDPYQVSVPSLEVIIKYGGAISTKANLYLVTHNLKRQWSQINILGEYLNGSKLDKDCQKLCMDVSKAYYNKIPLKINVSQVRQIDKEHMEEKFYSKL